MRHGPLWWWAGVCLLVANVSPARSAVPADSLAGVAVSCTDVRSGLALALRAQRLDSLGAIVPAWAAAATHLCLGAAQDVPVAMVADGEGGGIVVWTDLRTGEADLWAQRFSANGQVAPPWPGDGLPLCTSRGSQVAMALCTDGAGGAFVAWQDYRAGANADIHAQHLSASGDRLWNTDGVAVCDEAHDQGAPALVPDGSGGALVFWHDERSGAGDLRASHLTDAGLVAVPDVTLLSAPGAQRNPVAVSDGAGGAIVAWEDTRTGDADIRALRVDGALAPVTGFAADGVVIAGGAGEQFLPVLVADGAHGAVLAWCDRGKDVGDIRAQRLLGSGGVAWPEGGVLLCDAPGEQYAPVIASDGAGGAIVAWEDSRAGRPDIRAARVRVDGSLAWGTSGAAVCVAPGEQFAPAIAADGQGGALVTWTDAVQGARATMLSGRPVATGAVPQFVQLELAPGRASLRWSTPKGETRAFPLERRVGEEPWAELAVLHANEAGDLLHEDQGLAALAHVEYRLAIPTEAGLVLLPVVVAVIPAPPPFALRLARYEAAGDALQLRYALARSEAVSVELLDVAGRRVRHLALGETGAGEHEVRLPHLGLAAGWYYVRLHQGREVRGARLVVVR